MSNQLSDPKFLEGLVVLEYLNLGIIPFYPSSPSISTADRKSKRKFRKLWRKIASGKSMLEFLRSPGADPSNTTMYHRKKIVYHWVVNKVRKKYKTS